MVTLIHGSYTQALNNFVDFMETQILWGEFIEVFSINGFVEKDIGIVFWVADCHDFPYVY